MSLRKAINLKCKDCIYDPTEPGSWVQQVEGCEIRSCSLWPVRPKSRAKADCVANLGTQSTDLKLVG